MVVVIHFSTETYSQNVRLSHTVMCVMQRTLIIWAELSGSSLLELLVRRRCLGCQSDPSRLAFLLGGQRTLRSEHSPGSLYHAACPFQSGLSSLVVLREQEACLGRAKLLQLKDQRPCSCEKESHLFLPRPHFPHTL